jgi:hypothetical protein
VNIDNIKIHGTNVKTSYRIRSGPTPVQFRNDGGLTVQRSAEALTFTSSPEAERPVIAALKRTQLCRSEGSLSNSVLLGVSSTERK